MTDSIMKPRLSIIPCELAEANFFIERHHRHHGPVAGHKSRSADGADSVAGPPKISMTKPGDLYSLGDHRLLCGDSLKTDDVKRLMKGTRAALVSTDPPYGVDYTGDDRPKGRGKNWSHLYHELDIKDYSKFMESVIGNALDNSLDNAAYYIWHASIRQAELESCFVKKGLIPHQVIIWVKPRFIPGFSTYGRQYEVCLHGWKQKHKPPMHEIDQKSDVWQVDWDGMRNIVGNEHPTQKPVRLFEIPMQKHTRHGDVCYEPFAGSGSQIIAGERLQRRVYAMELEPVFCDVAVKRWEMFTGLKAKRLESLQPVE